MGVSLAGIRISPVWLPQFSDFMSLSSSLSMDHIFDSYQLQSAEPSNTINLELPLLPLQRALKSAANGTSASLRLTKKDGIPLLSMTITTSTTSKNDGGPSRFGHNKRNPLNAQGVLDGDDDDGIFNIEPLETHLNREREKIITQDIPVRVLHPEHVEMIMQPKVREPDVHIQLPPLMSLKAISDRFTKLAVAARVGSGTNANNSTISSYSPKLEIAANMHGSLRLSLNTDTLDVASQWDNLENPELDPRQLGCPIEEHPSTKFREEGPDKWATVRVDGKDWSKVLSVGRLEGRVIACFADEHALILYVYVPQYDDVGAEDSVVTYYVSSYSV
ncbi:checkpoint protein Hus1/Mec3 [Truncatella angustata]|uniref:Checkpoint protein n=1 Tax=Truncatella angustata TaxID=152316 RepID=A0A9P8UNL0_9PEZI|nr:checkpoint protein Hus1/Mec3 [Truncatella angustata]KAH6655355.1 checkpoint protein Hus1/Mec3 [Truncatella angustata]